MLQYKTWVFIVARTGFLAAIFFLVARVALAQAFSYV